MAGLWFSRGTPVSSTQKTDRHDITEIVLNVALNTIALTLLSSFYYEQMSNQNIYIYKNVYILIIAIILTVL
jgi:hypothetical protein